MDQTSKSRQANWCNRRTYYNNQGDAQEAVALQRFALDQNSRVIDPRGLENSNFNKNKN